MSQNPRSYKTLVTLPCQDDATGEHHQIEVAVEFLGGVDDAITASDSSYDYMIEFFNRGLTKIGHPNLRVDDAPEEVSSLPADSICDLVVTAGYMD